MLSMVVMVIVLRIIYDDNNGCHKNYGDIGDDDDDDYDDCDDE